ncbi:MAG: class I SAM-dependent methyltransferase [Calditrichaeota bacterium]|nr:class I SAM-dependent methyltransferase [Calditrichota bacterium]MBT7615766.1 class I SAM-dependent methyltransferase [Calditrichota bacterium]MBT7787394.1 class I SAM-dependent methyltransferase [Calditrichota bacterium]
MKLDLGCSYHKKAGYIGVDILRAEDVEVVADARCLPFKDSSIDGIFSSHCIEHIDDQLAVISEMWRVCRPDSELHILVPHFSNPSYYDDLTHQHRYSTRSFEHYDFDFHERTGHPNYLPNVNLQVFEVKLNYWPEHILIKKTKWKGSLIRAAKNFLNYIANKNQFFCERIWCRWVGGFFEVEYKILVHKDK